MLPVSFQTTSALYLHNNVQAIEKRPWQVALSLTRIDADSELTWYSFDFGGQNTGK